MVYDVRAAFGPQELMKEEFRNWKTPETPRHLLLHLGLMRVDGWTLRVRIDCQVV